MKFINKEEKKHTKEMIDVINIQLKNMNKDRNREADALTITVKNINEYRKGDVQCYQ